MIFGGDAFDDWYFPLSFNSRNFGYIRALKLTWTCERIGELSLMKDLTRTMEITMKEMEEEEATDDDEEKSKTPEVKSGPSSPGIPSEKPAGASSSDVFSSLHGSVPSASGTGTPAAPTPSSELPLPTAKASPTTSRSTTPRPKGIPTRQMLTDKSEEDRMAAEALLTEDERELKRKERKKAGMTKKQREAFLALQKEQRETRQKRVDMLTRKLIDRISVWTETDKGTEVTHSFNEKTKFEVENLKMESFGIEILHGESTTRKPLS